ncbi:MAG TPA: hypothetical protein VII83_01075 [Gaiellaceae bacterium]|jgi:hypothetical protein
MELGRRRVAELVALLGVVLGFIALFVETFDVDGYTGKYTDDGTVLTVLIILLGLAACCLVASLMLGKVILDLIAAVTGAAALGIFLYIPAILAFKNLGKLGWGGWLGIAAVLTPVGAGAAQLWHRRSDAKAPGITLWTVAAAIGLVLITIGIWSEYVDKSGLSYWQASYSGHAMGLLLLALVIASAICILAAANARKAELSDLAMIVSAVLVGLAVANPVHQAFGHFGNLGTGGWLGLVGGLVLLLALIGNRLVKLPELMKK